MNATTNAGMRPCHRYQRTGMLDKTAAPSPPNRSWKAPPTWGLGLVPAPKAPPNFPRRYRPRSAANDNHRGGIFADSLRPMIQKAGKKGQSTSLGGIRRSCATNYESESQDFESLRARHFPFEMQEFFGHHCGWRHRAPVRYEGPEPSYRRGAG